MFVYCVLAFVCFMWCGLPLCARSVCAWWAFGFLLLFAGLCLVLRWECFVADMWLVIWLLRRLSCLELIVFGLVGVFGGSYCVGIGLSGWLVSVCGFGCFGCLALVFFAAVGLLCCRRAGLICGLVFAVPGFGAFVAGFWLPAYFYVLGVVV